ncbi:MAG: histidine kinase [Faecalibacterium sp.]
MNLGKTTQYLFCIFVVFALIIWGCTSPSVTSAVDAYQTTLFHQGWSQQIGDDSIVLADIQDYIAVEEGESLVFTCTLPEIDDDISVLFYAVDKEVVCYVDGVLMQNYIMQDGFTLFKTPGSVWIQIDLDSSMSGKPCTLVFNSPLGRYETLCDIYFVGCEYIDTVRFTYLWPTMLSVVGIVFVWLIITFMGIIEQQTHRKRYLFAIAQYFLVVLLWLLAECNAYDIVFSRPIISYLLSEAFKRMLPLALLHLAEESTNRYWHLKLFRSIRVLAWLNLIVPFALTFTLGISLLETAVLHCVVTIIIHITLLFIIGQKAHHLKTLNYEEYPSLAVPILIVGSGVDNVILCSNWSYHPFVGVLTTFSAIVFSVAALLVLAYINTQIAKEKVAIEAICRDLENGSLVKQLEAHFIFNVLNTISSFCKTDPQAADAAITTFAKYLRQYLHLVDQRQNIPMQQELELVTHYLRMQQMRFAEKLNFVIDAPCTDFEIPPFAVHTLVENAVVHGIGRCGRGGTVRISCECVGNIAQVIVSDTGVGFDTAQPVKATSVGLLNTKRRLKIMCGGTIQITSNIGKGTMAVITIPRDMESSMPC